MKQIVLIYKGKLSMFDYQNYYEYSQSQGLDQSQIVVYGHYNCSPEGAKAQVGYRTIQKDMRHRIGEFEKLSHMITFHVGWRAEETNTFEGKAIYKIKLNVDGENGDSGHSTSEVCKAGIVNVVLENYLRLKENKEIIPLVFFVNPRYLDSQQICDKSLNMITNSEIRRGYKLVNLQALSRGTNEYHDIFKEINAVAAKTIHFMTLHCDSATDKIIFREHPKPWEQSDWQDSWKSYKICWRDFVQERENRLKQRFGDRYCPLLPKEPKPFPWRDEVIAFIKNLPNTSS